MAINPLQPRPLLVAVPVLLSLLACTGWFNPAGTKLTEANALQKAGDQRGAMAIYEEVMEQWPESDEAGLASVGMAVSMFDLSKQPSTSAEEALELTLAVIEGTDVMSKKQAVAQIPARYTQRIDELFKEAPWDAGALASEAFDHPNVGKLGMNTTLLAYRDESPDYTDKDLFGAGFAWTVDAGRPTKDRVLLGATLAGESGFHEAVVAGIEEFMAKPTPGILGPVCLVDVGGMSDLRKLVALQRTCEALVLFAPDSTEAKKADAVLEAVSARMGELIGHPSE